MANGQGGLSPLQQFISQYMETGQFLEQQRQAIEQEQLAQRQIENQELTMFGEMARSIQQPGQRQALLDVFIQRNPDAATSFQALADALPVSIQTRMENAGADMSPGEFASALRRSTGLELTEQEAADLQERQAGRQQQNSQFFAQLADSIRRTDLAFDELGVQRALGFGRLNLDAELGRRGLDIEATDVSNRFNLGQGQLNVSGGTWPDLMLGEQSRAIQELEARKRQPLIHPARLQAIEAEIADRKVTMSRLEELRKANLINLMGGMPGGDENSDLAGMDLNQLFQAAETAQRQVDEAKDPGTQASALARLRLVNELLNRAQQITPQPLLEQSKMPRSLWDMLPLLSGPNVTRVVPPEER